MPDPASISMRMQQPLAHLYFMTVLEHILNDDQSLSNIVRTALQLLHQCTSGDLEPAHQVILQIELQAVLQMTAKFLAGLLDAADHIIEIEGSIEEINYLLGDVSTGGGVVGGHGMVVALHLLKMLKSSRKFIELMTTKFEIVCKKVECLRPIHNQFQVSLR